MPVQTCSSLPATCCTVSKSRSCIQALHLNVSAFSASQSSRPGSTARHPSQLFRSRLLQKQRVRVANPRHEGEQDAARQPTDSWDEPPTTDVGHDESQHAFKVDWAKVQSLAALTGASTLAAVIVLQLSGKTDLPKLAYENVPESVQEALPEQLTNRSKQRKNTWQPLDFGAFLDQAKGRVQQEGLALQEGVQKEGLALSSLPGTPGPAALQSESAKPDKPSPKDKVKADRQVNLEKSKQVKTAKNEQTKKEKEQRQKQKEKEKEKDVAERKLKEQKEKEQKEKERKEGEKRKKFRDQALLGGSIFGMSAFTFGKWQLFASLGAVVFRTIGGPTILSSVLRTPGYIIGRGVRIVEWDVAEHPDKPDGDLMSMKLRALTPDGIRMAIAKAYGLSNYREVRQVSHWVTTAAPHFFEPMRTAAAFKMLPDPAFVVWSRHPPTGRHTLPTRADQAPTSDSASQDPLTGLPSDQVTAVMLKTISGVAAASRRLAEAGHLQHSTADQADHLSNGSSHSQSGHASTGSANTAEAKHACTSAVQPTGHHRHSATSSSSSSSSLSSPQLAGQESGRHTSTSAAISSHHETTSSSGSTPSHHHSHSSNGDGSSLQGSASSGCQPAGPLTHQPELADHEPAKAGATVRSAEQQHNDGDATSSARSYGDGVHHSARAGSWDQPQRSAESGDEQAAASSTGSEQNEREALAAAASCSFNNGNGSSPGNSNQELAQHGGQPGQYQSNEDEVAGVLQDETDANGPPARPKDLQYWHEPAVLQAVCVSPSVSICTWGERLQLSSNFVPVSEAEEEALVLAVGASGDFMLSLFRAYAPHNILTFMHFARRHCIQA